MVFKHILSIEEIGDKYTLKLDGKLVNTDLGPINNKDIEFLFLGLASLDDILFQEGVVVMGGKFETDKGLDTKEVLSYCCNKYNKLIQDREYFKEKCQKAKDNFRGTLEVLS